MNGAEPTSAERYARAIYSTRIGNGRFSPLVGKTSEAMIGKEATKGLMASAGAIAEIAGPVALVGTAAIATAKGMYDLTDASAKATENLTSLKVQSGGSMADAARIQALGVIGASGQSARGFQERITSDPMAMSAAGSLGIRNLKGPFGNMDFGRQYLDAIKKTAAIGDENQRHRLAYILGIEEEVARYRLLSPETRSRLDALAQQTGRINDPAAQAGAAEFAAAQQAESLARQNLVTALGKGPMSDLTALLNNVAAAEQWVAEKLNQFPDAAKKFTRIVESSLGVFGGAAAISGQWKDTFGGDSTKPGADAHTDAVAAQTKATIGLTDGISQLNGTIRGAGVRGGNSIERFRDTGGAGLHEAWVTGSMAMGALG